MKRLLYQAIYHRRDTQGAHPALRLCDLHLA